MSQIIDQLAASIREAAARGTPLRIVGGGTKDFYGGALRGETLATSAYRGIVEYDPTELVITARAGTPLAEIEGALREKRQMLAFEPPHFGATTTLGGCVAAGLSGPRRACAGAVRDFVLGVRMLDGNGRDLHFGGRVMKNVAGYDVSRLMAGSLGTLGLILEASLKVLPLPPAEATLHLKCAEAEALALMNEWAGKPLPITATAFRNDDLGVRLSGAGAAVEAAAKRIGGTRVDTMLAGSFWNGIREQTDAWFSDARPLWRLSVKSTTPPLDLPGSQLIEWGGALRWLKTDAEARTIRETAARARGHATLFRGGDKAAGVFQPLSTPLMKIHQRLKQSFDPAGILNPGRMYPEF
ncbi:MAG: glycolate oxidase subunit GlcE [Betaproteobacteria bacterium]|nr:glycolate oxidase subunit GlcE [Betaproteobacteria bacterium]